MGRAYTIHEFAELAGVSVKALRHYDRLGLLKPSRSNAGYRSYSQRDLERLEQIVALKSLGFRLKQVRVLLEGSTVTLGKALLCQRRALEEKQMLLGRAIRAIDGAAASPETDPALLRKIIEVLAMQDGIQLMKKYYSTEEAWEMRRRYYEEGPSPEWRALYRDISAALGEDPGSDHAQALAERWLELSLKAAKGDPALQTDSPSAWMDREHWPPAMRQRIADFNLEEVFKFITKASAATSKRYFTERAWARLIERRRERLEFDLSASWQARVDLFGEIESALHEDSGSPRAQELANRWLLQIEHDSVGDAEVKSGWMKAWADRVNWPAALRWQMEALYMMPHERILKCAGFIDRTISRQHIGSRG